LTRFKFIQLISRILSYTAFRNDGFGIGREEESAVCWCTNVVNRMATGHRRTDTYYCQHLMCNPH